MDADRAVRGVAERLRALPFCAPAYPLARRPAGGPGPGGRRVPARDAVAQQPGGAVRGRRRRRRGSAGLVRHARRAGRRRSPVRRQVPRRAGRSFAGGAGGGGVGRRRVGRAAGAGDRRRAQRPGAPVRPAARSSCGWRWGRLPWSPSARRTRHEHLSSSAVGRPGRTRLHARGAPGRRGGDGGRARRGVWLGVERRRTGHTCRRPGPGGDHRLGVLSRGGARDPEGGRHRPATHRQRPCHVAGSRPRSRWTPRRRTCSSSGTRLAGWCGGTPPARIWPTTSPGSR